MKVLLIHPILWSHYKARVFSELYFLLEKAKFEFLVLQVASTENMRKNLGEPDRSIHKYPYKLLFEGAYEDTSFMFRLRSFISYIDEYRPDVIILPGYYDSAVLTLMAYCNIKKIRIIQTVDSNQYDYKRSWLKEQVKSIVLSFSDLIFCYGKMQIEYLKLLNVPLSKIHVRVQATDNDKFVIDNKLSISCDRKNLPESYFLYVGRLSEEKNLKNLLIAFHKSRSDWSLVLVGDGNQGPELVDFVRRHQIANVVFVGGKSWEEVVPYYKSAKAFVLPSLREPWGLVVNEAMLCGLPLIVSKHCGCCKDLLDEGKNGFSFWPTEITELVDIFDQFTEMTSEELLRFGKHSSEIIKNYTPERSAEQMFSGILKLS